MNYSKILFAFSIIGVAAPMQTHTAGIAYKPEALMAAASTASAVLANGIIAIGESIKKEKLFELGTQVAQLSKENNSLSLENDRLNRFMTELVPNQVNGPSTFELAAICTIVVAVICLVDQFDETPQFAPQPKSYTQERLAKA